MALRQALVAVGRRRGRGRVRERLRGGEGGRRGCSPTLLLLDVQMPKLDGFEVLELVGARRAGDLRDGLRRVRAAGVRGARGGLPAEAVRARAARGGARRGRASARGAPGRRRRRCARARGRRARRSNASSFATARRCTWSPVEKIDYVEAQDDYVAFQTGGKTLLKEQTLGDLEAQLDAAAVRPRSTGRIC